MHPHQPRGRVGVQAEGAHLVDHEGGVLATCPSHNVLRIGFDHRFTFTSQKALDTVRPHYSERVLEEVRLSVARLSPAQLKRLNPLSEIYEKRDQDAYNAYRDATAHAMLERGILVYMDDRAGGVYIAQ